MSIQIHDKDEVKQLVLSSLKWLILFTFSMACILLLFSKYHFSFHIGAQKHSVLAALFLFGAIISFVRLFGSVLKTCWVLFWLRGAQDNKLKTERMLSALLLVFVGLVFIYLAIKEILAGRMLINLSRHTAQAPITTLTDFWFSVVLLILAGLFFCAIPAYGYYKLRKSALNNDSA